MIRHAIYALGTRIRGSIFLIIFRSHICGNGKIFFDKNSHIILAKNCRINVNGTLRLNANCIVNNGRSTLLRIDQGGQLNVNGDVSVFYGGDIIIFEGAKLDIGNSFINSDSKIRCHTHISIGDNCAISHNLTIMDSDVHYLNGDNHKQSIQIGNHVWIGTHVTILSGVTIGDGAVIAAGTLVSKDVAPKTLVAGIPCKVIKRDVDWSK